MLYHSYIAAQCSTTKQKKQVRIVAVRIGHGYICFMGIRLLQDGCYMKTTAISCAAKDNSIQPVFAFRDQHQAENDRLPGIVGSGQQRNGISLTT
ncbi:MAG: hypothetical protein HQL77_07190 [Magnetococcales bacterium]|nr:hypothetical protein [Magnetococcales bacterium]